MRKVYADNAATTKISERSLNRYTEVAQAYFGNPSSIHSVGNDAKCILEQCRTSISEIIGANPKEIFFTSGGSESDNWAIKGVAELLKTKGKNHIITSKIEHHAVLHTVEYLNKNGFDITYLAVGANGFISPVELENSLTEKTALVSIMFANNEIGTIEPIKEIGEICHKNGVLFHTDAVQAVGSVPINVKELNIDLLSLSAHKFHGPRGIGALYCKSSIRLPNLIHGGAQENLRRAGTENLPAIAAMTVALEDAVSNMDKRNAHLIEMRNSLVSRLSQIEKTKINGDLIQRLPGNVNVCFQGIEGESLLLMLDFAGISASSGSACTSGSLDPSHVLLAIGLPHEIAHGSLRLTLSEENTLDDVNYIMEKLVPIVEQLREMSPVWERIKLEENENV